MTATADLGLDRRNLGRSMARHGLTAFFFEFPIHHAELGSQAGCGDREASGFNLSSVLQPLGEEVEIFGVDDTHSIFSNILLALSRESSK